MREDESVLTKAIIDLVTDYGRYGYRRVTALLHRQGWQVNHKQVERIWRREGLKVPQKQPKRARLWLNDGSCIRLRATHPNHVWSYDFVMDKTACALGHNACLHGYTTRYYRLSRLLLAFTQAKADGSYHKLLAQTAKIRLLLIDDWGLNALTTAQRHDLMEIMDDRHGNPQR